MKLLMCKSHAHTDLQDAQDQLFAISQFEFIKWAYIDIKDLRVVYFADWDGGEPLRGQRVVEAWNES